MNQDSFRQLLTTPRPGSLSSSATGSGQATKKSIINSSQPAFQPRKVKKKKSEAEYRDRALERRAGVNDYAQVESVLEDFEQRTAAIEDREAVEEQRRYLGGDRDHTILVKGLDFALLEQNKARAAASHEDDDSLEAAFQEAQPQPMVPKKRTREDLIRALKEKRGLGSTEAATQQLKSDDTLERAKQIGKFKPIGPPDPLKGSEKSKKSKGKERERVGEGERKKKRRKVGQELVTASEKHPSKLPRTEASMPPPPEPPKPSFTQGTSTNVSIALRDPGNSLLELGSQLEAEDVDIFADAGEYEGVDFGDDEDDERPERINPVETVVPGPSESDGFDTVKSWFKDDDGPTSIPGPSVARSPTPPPVKPASAESEEPEPEQVTRLAPLASSALPSISDFLALDAQAEARNKRKAKKEKKKGGEKKEKVSAEVKVNRDYKKLNSYMAKKGGGPEDAV